MLENVHFWWVLGLIVGFAIGAYVGAKVTAELFRRGDVN